MSTSVTVNESSNTVSVNETTNEVTVSQGSTQTVEVNVAGPQGSTGGTIAINDSNKVDKSIIYYDSSAGTYKADSTWTVSTLVFGGDF